MIKDHVLLRRATAIEDVDAEMARTLGPGVLDEILSTIPDAWLTEGGGSRDDYRRYLVERLAPPRGFVEEAVRVR